MQPFLRTKTLAPPLRPRLVERPRLLERLNEGSRRALTIVCAGAGFGKTTLAAVWTQTRLLPVAWLTLEPADRPPEQFLAYLIQALQAISPHIGKTTLALLRGGSPEGALFALVNDMADIESDLVLVLDDYHNVDSQASAEIVQFLLENRPASFHLIILTRIAPTLNLTRLRAQDQVTEIDDHALRFTQAEVDAFLRNSMGLDLSNEESASLGQATEGWAVGLQLLALARQPTGLPASAGQEQVFAYLAEQVLRREPPEVRDFLQKTALFDRFCASLGIAVLCPDAMVEQGEAWFRQLLNQVDRSNLFLIPLDDKGAWYRYHSLFADFLRQRVSQQEARPLYNAASYWFEQTGSLDDAIRYAVLAANYERAASMLEEQYIGLLSQGRQSALLAWIEAIPSAVWQTRPRLWLAKGWASVTLLDTAAADACVTSAEALLLSDDYSSDRLRGEARSLHLLSGVFSGRSVSSEEITAIARLLPEEDDFLHGLMQLNVGAMYVMAGETAQAIAAFDRSARIMETINAPLFAVIANVGLGEAYQMCGSFGAAERTFKKAIDYVKKRLGEHSFLLCVLYISYADLLRELNHLDEALHYVEVGITYSLVWRPVASLDGQVVLARILAAQGKWQESFNRLEQAMQVSREGSIRMVDDYLAIHLSRLMLLQGDLARARHLIRLFDLESIVSQTFYHLQEPAQLTLCRAEVAASAGESAAVKTVIEKLLTLIGGAEQRERTTNLIEGLILLAYAQEQAGQRAAVNQSLSQALKLGAHSGYLRIFVDEGKKLLQLLEVYGAEIQAPSAYLNQLLTLLREEAARHTPVQRLAWEGVTTLTRRELDILSLLAAGRSNQEIADERVLALNTVKKHVANILSKLGVANRTQAALLARQLGWLA